MAYITMRETLTRALNLVRMDNDVRERINDEELILDIWFSVGVADGTVEFYDYGMIMDLAQDQEDYNEIVKTYMKICKLDGIEPIADIVIE